MQFIFRLSSLVFLLVTTSMYVNAAGTIDFLEVDNDVLTFSTTEAKTHTSPTCVVEQTKQKWTIKLNTPTGKATYTLLMTAMSTGKTVNVETAGDCAFVQGVERAKRVWIVK